MKKNSLSKVLSLSTESGIEPSLSNSKSVQSTDISAGLSEWCANAPLFFDDVYKNGTREKKQQAVASQTGRSMIEMLGVLAIIGVLSVGGIAGYSKAMMKFKINKTADQIATIVANVRTLYSSQKNYIGLTTTGRTTNKTLIKKAHIVPDDMYESASSTDFTHPFGGGVDILESDKKTSGDSKAFMITYYDVPEEACMELATMDWGSGSSSGLIAVGAVDFTDIDTQLVNCTGDTTKGIACPNGSKVSVPMPVSVAASVCSGNSNEISWKYY